MTDKQLAVYIEQIRQNLQHIYNEIEQELPDTMQRFNYSTFSFNKNDKLDVEKEIGRIIVLEPLYEYIESLEQDRDMLGDYE